MNQEQEQDPYKCLKEAHASGKIIEKYDPIFHKWNAIIGDPNWEERPDHYRIPAKGYELKEYHGAGIKTKVFGKRKTFESNPSALQEAEALINGDRAEQYGKASENFNDIAAGWSVLFKTKVTAEQVAIAMIWLKSCRYNHKEGRDSIVDIAGYAGCIEKIQKGE